MSKKLLHSGGVLLTLLLLNFYSFSQKRIEQEHVKTYADTIGQNFFYEDSGSIGEWKNSRDFAYMKYLDSLLRNQKELRSDTTSISTGTKQRQRNNANGALLPFLNSAPVKIFFWMAALFFVAFILYRIFLNNRLFSFSNNRITNKAEEDAVILHESSEYDTLIAQAEFENDWNLSTRYLYLKAIKTLSDKELIRFAPDKTNHEYLQEMAGHSLAKDFSSLTRNYEYIWYGKFVIDTIQYQNLKQQFNQFIKKV